MARHKEFDREKVLERAMYLFWEKGYEATSVQDLVDRTGIGRGSLYGTFGDKHALFLAALDRYGQAQGPLFAEILDGPGPARAKLRLVFEGIVEAAVSEDGRCGCLLVNSTVELAPHDPDTSKRVDAALLDAEEALYGFLVRARVAGEIPQDKDPRSLSRFLWNAVQGLRVMAKAGARKEVLDDIVNVTLSVLD